MSSTQLDTSDTQERMQTKNKYQKLSIIKGKSHEILLRSLGEKKKSLRESDNSHNLGKKTQSQQSKLIRNGTFRKIGWEHEGKDNARENERALLKIPVTGATFY